jgi:hypothetical protein
VLVRINKGNQNRVSEMEIDNNGTKTARKKEQPIIHI